MGKKTAEKYDKQLIRENRELRFVRLGSMRISPLAQRELKSSRVNYLTSVMDLEKLGNPEVSFRDGHYYVMDGQHRVRAVEQWLGAGWQDQNIQCWVATGLSERQEAEIFLSLNDVLPVSIYQKFKRSICAGRRVENEIEDVVKSVGLTISRQGTPGSIGAVGSLLKVFKRDGGDSLRQALVIIKDAFGDCGFLAPIIEGFGLFCGRYNSVLDGKIIIEALSKVNGGAAGLLNNARSARQHTGKILPHCVAAEAVRIINRGRPQQTKLPSWDMEDRK